MNRALPRPLILRYAPVWPYLYWTATIIGALYCTASIMGLTGIGSCSGGFIACDAAAYYFADGYAPVSSTPQYGYSPAFLWAFAPFHLLPFDAFVWVWYGLHVAALLWLRAGYFLAIPGVNEDVIRGNIGVFVAVALVLALRYPFVWAFPLLTKVLPGVGVIWHMARREWRHLAVALGATLAVVAVGALVNPQLWIEWVTLLGGRGTEVAGSIIPRLILAAGIVAYAGYSDRAWMLPFALVVGGRGITPPSLMKLAALPRLLDRRPH